MVLLKSLLALLLGLGLSGCGLPVTGIEAQVAHAYCHSLDSKLLEVKSIGPNRVQADCEHQVTIIFATK